MSRVISYQATVQSRFHRGAQLTELMHVFVMGTNGHIYSNYWDGQQWKWVDQGIPSGLTTLAWTEAITYLDPVDHKQHIYVFTLGQSQKSLYVNYWDGEQWTWADQGA